MKKLFILSLAAAFVVALSMPAWAWVGADQVQFGARINQEIGWHSKSKERTTNKIDDINRSYLKTNSNSYLRLKFASKDKSQGALVELGVGSGSALGSNTISTRHAYGWYKVGNCTLTVGHTDNWVGNTFWGAQKLQAESHSGDILGWGKAWAPRRAQVQFKYDAGKMATLMFALARPSKDGSPTNASTAGMDKYYQIPQVELAVQLKGKSWSVIPSAVWYQAKFDKAPSGYDDTVTSWGFILPAKVAFGAFSVMAEIHYGQNTQQPVVRLQRGQCLHESQRQHRRHQARWWLRAVGLQSGQLHHPCGCWYGILHQRRLEVRRGLQRRQRDPEDVLGGRAHQDRPEPVAVS